MATKDEENSREIAVLKYKLQDQIDKLENYQKTLKEEIKELEDKQNDSEKEIEKLRTQSTYIKGFLKAIVIVGSLIAFFISVVDKFVPK